MVLNYDGDKRFVECVYTPPGAWTIQQNPDGTTSRTLTGAAPGSLTIKLANGDTQTHANCQQGSAVKLMGNGWATLQIQGA